MIFAPFLLLPAMAAAERPAYAPEQLSLVRQITDLRISPAGDELAFISDITGALEVWKVDAQGGWPIQLSDLGQAASSLRYSPDGRTLVFTSDRGGDERPDIFLVPSEGGVVENITKSTQAETSPRFSPDGTQLAYTSDPGRPFLFQLMVMDLASRRTRQLTREAVNVREPVWAPDGEAIAVTRTGDDERGELLLVNADNGSMKVILPPVKGGILFAQQFSSNGKNLLCLARNQPGFMQLYMLETDTGKGRFMGPGDWDVTQAVLHPKAGIIFARNEGGTSAVYRLTGPESYKPLVAEGGHIEMLDAAPDGRLMSFLWGNSSAPAEAWVIDLKKNKTRGPLTQSLMGGVNGKLLSKGRVISYPSADKREIHALVLKPAVRRLGTPPPAVVVVHGGPNGQTMDEFSPLKQALAEAGFEVIAPNYRGSTGYGKEFEDANNMDWGGKDLQDLIAGVRYLSDKKEIDGTRVGITGGSFGGYLTLMALAKSSAVWSAGVEAYGMPDLVQDYELTKDRFGDWYASEMGTPMTKPQLFHDRSAINFLGNIKAPLLIFQGANDTNVPLAESRLIYDGLKKRGAAVELVVYPDEGHEFTRRKNLSDYYRKTVDFFARHLSAK